MSSSSAQHVGEKARQDQQNPASSMSEAGGVGLDAGDAVAGANATRKRAISPRPARRSTSTPAAMVASSRASAQNQPDERRRPGQRRRFPRPAATGWPIEAHFTNDIGDSPARRGWRRGRDRLWFDSSDLRRPTGARLWIGSVACLHYSGGTGPCCRGLCVCGPCRRSAVPILRLPRACETCSISTPSSSWRWRCSFSCACAACSASAPAASGRPTIPIPRATPCAPRQATRSWRCRAARRDAAQKAAPSRPSRSSAGRASPSRARRSPRASTPSRARTRASTPSISSTGARAAYEMIVTAYADGDRRQLKNLLAREVYDGFEAAIREREQRGETVETPLRLDRPRRHHRRRAARQDRAGHGALRVAARLGDARQGRHRDRRQPRQGHRRHRRLDLRARLSPRAIPTGSWSRPKPGNDVGSAGCASLALQFHGFGGAALSLLAVASVARRPQRRDPMQVPDTQLEPIDLGRDRRLGRRRSRRRLRRLPQQLQGDPAAARKAMRDGAADLWRAVRGLPAGGGRQAAQAAARRARSSSRTSARCGSRRSASADGFLTGYYEPIVDGSRFPSRRISTYPLYRKPPNSGAAGARRRRRHGCANARQERPQAPARRELVPYLRPRRDRGRRARRPRARNLLAEGPDRCVLRPDPGLGAGAARGRHDAAAQLRRRTTAIPTTRSGAFLIERNIVPREEMSMDRIRRLDGGQSGGGQGAAAQEQVLRVLPR